MEEKITSTRNAFIRISQHNVIKKESKYHNYKANEIVDYSFEQICQLLSQWAESKQFLYYAIEHDADIDENSNHYHIVLKFNSPTQWDQIKKKFPLGYIEKCKHGVTACIQYLIHLNDPTKVQYSWESIVHNDPNGIERFKNKSDKQKLNDLLIKIGNGQIREYEITKYVDVLYYVKNKKKIETALEFFMHKQARNIDRNIKVFVFQGDARVGKTDMAKAYSYLKGYDAPCISGGSNDPWQFYQGHEVMILDDVRDSTFKLSDLLKIIDPYNNTPVPRRYSNTYFLGNYIILTTNKPIWNFYSGETVSEESKKALFARINRIIDFTRDDNGIYFHPIRYNIDKDRFEKSKTQYDYKPLRKLTFREKNALMESAEDYDNPEEVFSLFESVDEDGLPQNKCFNEFAEGNYEVLQRNHAYVDWRDPESLEINDESIQEEQDEQGTQGEQVAQVGNYTWNPEEEIIF